MRNFPNFLDGYLRYTEGTESPEHMRLFAAMSAICGSLRRQVWVDLVKFTYYPAMYVVFVGEPGIVTKSVTTNAAMALLKEVEGVFFGPDAVTWAALAGAFVEANTPFQFEDAYYPQSALTIFSSELGSFLDLRDAGMVNFLIELWDGRGDYKKMTKHSGNDNIDAPYLNFIACTTPSWIAENLSRLALGGGLTSRTIFLYGGTKSAYVPWPDLAAPKDVDKLRVALVEDLRHMATLRGPMSFTPAARQWMIDWYQPFWENEYPTARSDWQKGYMARKYGHLIKLAMVLSVATSDSLVITDAHFAAALAMLKRCESDMEKVFEHVGKSEKGLQVGRAVESIGAIGATFTRAQFFKALAGTFPDHNEADNILKMLCASGKAQNVPGNPDLFVLRS